MALQLCYVKTTSQVHMQSSDTRSDWHGPCVHVKISLPEWIAFWTNCGSSLALQMATKHRSSLASVAHDNAEQHIRTPPTCQNCSIVSSLILLWLTNHHLTSLIPLFASATLLKIVVHTTSVQISKEGRYRTTSTSHDWYESYFVEYFELPNT